MKKFVAAYLFAGLCWVAAPVVANYADPITITTDIRQAFAPATVRVKVQIPPDASNRSFCVGVDSADYSTQSCRGLEGKEAPRTTWHLFRDLPAGEYAALVTVYRAGGTTRTVSTQFRLLGDGEMPADF